MQVASWEDPNWETQMVSGLDQVRRAKLKIGEIYVNAGTEDSD